MKERRDDSDGGGQGADSIRRAREDLYAVERGLRSQAPGGDREMLSRLLAVVEKINAELDVSRVLEVAARELISVFEAERVFIIEVGAQGQLVFRLAVDFRGQPLAQPESEISHAVVQDVVGKLEPVLVRDATTDPRFAEVSSVRHLELHSVMAAPLMAQGELLGVVYADNRLLSGAFDQHRLNLLGIFANHVGIALRNARLFHELDAARAELALSERLKAIGEVATFIAHQVKNPLGSIKILLEELEKNWADRQTREKVLAVVPAEVDRLNKAVGQILDYARVTPLLKVPVSLPALLDSAIRTLAPEVKKLEVQVHRDFERDLPDVLTDGERIREVFINLIGNALQAMAGRPKRELKLSVRRFDSSREEVVIEDTGPGIPEAEIDRIFEPFRTLKASGTGVGLALCQKLVREHGGAVAAENAPGGGARFTVLLPIRGA